MRGNWASGGCWAWPKWSRGKPGYARGRQAGRAVGCCWAGPKTEKVNEIPLLFIFNIFKANFQMIFEFSFVFSKSAHNTKYYAAA
jgi:hypothetical protein